MEIKKFSPSDANPVKLPGQESEIYVANLIDQRDGGPVTIGYGRYAPDQSLTETIAVYDTMIVLEERLSVSTSGSTVSARQGDIVYMPKAWRSRLPPKATRANSLRHIPALGGKSRQMACEISLCQ